MLNYTINDILINNNNSNQYKVISIITEDGNDWHDRIDLYYFAILENLNNRNICKDIIGYTDIYGFNTIYYKKLI